MQFFTLVSALGYQMYGRVPALYADNDPAVQTQIQVPCLALHMA